MKIHQETCIFSFSVALVLFLCHVRHSHSQIRKKAFTETDHAAPRSWISSLHNWEENSVCHLSHTDHGILLWQLEMNNTDRVCEAYSLCEQIVTRIFFQVHNLIKLFTEIVYWGSSKNFTNRGNRKILFHIIIIMVTMKRNQNWLKW